ncbi:MAG: NAD(P)/FAD-dependent oxidoreductase [Alphaproteobacteria bacterium]|nr:NAD(P)/FAD-dependent oxidoreductase [Alphaproteobacteria bacterium]
MSQNEYDGVIVGGGHNALVCGAYMARAGKRVLVLERRPMIGGAAVSEEVWPGYKVSIASFIMALLQPKVILDLELKKYGMEVLPAPPLFMPLPEGGSVTLWPDQEKMRDEIARLSPADGRAYLDYRKHMAGLAPFLQRLLWEIPPNVGSRRPKDLLAMLKLAVRYWDIGPKFYDFYDVLTQSAYDYLGRWFENDTVKAMLSYYAGGGGGNGSPKTPATAYALLRPFVRDHGTAAGGPGFIRGGMSGISEAIAASGRAHGLEIRTNAEVRRIIIKNGQATGVELASGDCINARAVIANADAKTTFMKLIGKEALPTDFAAAIENFRTTSSVFKINLAVTKLPHYTAFDPKAAGYDYPVQVRIGSSIDYLERAFDESKYGGIAKSPLLTVMAPSVVDDTLAPPGMHLLSIFGGHVAYDLKDMDWDQGREILYDRVMDTIETYAPGIRQTVAHRQILAPPDLERILCLPGGHVHHGDITVDQIFFRRPAPGYADYRTPFKNLFLCSASVHPGGGVTGVPGHNAAKVILGDLK